MIPGDKINPHPVKSGAVQVDGMALEFNIDPANTFNQFTSNINHVLSDLRKMVPKEYDMVAVPAVTFSDEVMASTPKEALILGCDPDFNAYTESQNGKPEPSKGLRTAAGHIHLGWGEFNVNSEEHWNNCVGLVKVLDRLLGVWSLTVDEDHTRRCLYGKAGAFRVKPYGLEYRVLSNFWVFDIEHRATVWDLCKSAFDWWQKEFSPDKRIMDEHGFRLHSAQEMIDSGSTKRARSEWPYLSLAVDRVRNGDWV